MSYFVVNRTAGPAWTDGKGAFDQPALGDHVAYMNSLAEEGVVLFAGPVAGSEQARIRVVLIASGTSAENVRVRLADDPWERADRLKTSSVEPWNLMVGAERM